MHPLPQMKGKSMKAKPIFSVALVLALAVLTTFGIRQSRAASTLIVDDDNVECPSASYASIQAAVNAAAGDTIQVCSGNYNENVIIPLSLTLNGAQAGVDARGRVAPESTVNGANPIGSNPVFSIQAPSVTIDGFTIKNSITTNAAIGVTVKTAGNGSAIANNIFDAINTHRRQRHCSSCLP
jgi:nitrous oxidase accessory protein NosD